MALSYVTYTGNGTQTDYTIPFTYLSQSDIFVFVNDVSVPFTWLNSSSVRATTSPAAASVVQVRRITQKVAPPVDFTDGAVLLESDLDSLARYTLFIAQEIEDAEGSRLGLDYTNTYQAQGHKISNLADPVAPQDAVTKAYLEGPYNAKIGNQVTEATSQAGLALAAANAAAASYDSFDDRYLGSKASDPVLDNDGNALLTGAMYFNSTVNELRAYSGSQWIAGASSSFSAQRFNGTGVQTVFVLSTSPASIYNTQVYINGVYQSKDTYTLVGQTITFSEAPPVGTASIEVMVIATLALGATSAELVSFVGSSGVGGVSATTVQGAITELATRSELAVNIRDFGAKANDPLFDNRTAINAAINYVYSSFNGGTVIIDDLYYSSAEISVKSNVALDGQNRGTLKLLDNCVQDYYAFISLVSVQNSSIKNLVVDQNVANQTRLSLISGAANARIGIYLVATTNVDIINNTLHACGVWAIIAQPGPSYPSSYNCNILSNRIDWVQSNSVQHPDLPLNVLYDNTMIFIESDGFNISNNTLTTSDSGAMTGIEMHKANGRADNNSITGFRTGLFCVTVQDHPETVLHETSMIVSNNKIYDVEEGVILHPYNDLDLSGIQILNNQIELSPSRFQEFHSNGISVKQDYTSTQTAKITNVRIIGNRIKFSVTSKVFADANSAMNFSGISLQGWIDVSSVIITDNEITNAPAIGILIGGKSIDAKVYVSREVLVANNIIKDAGRNINIPSTLKGAIVLLGGFKGIDIQPNLLVDTKGTDTYAPELLIQDLLQLNSFSISEQTYYGNYITKKDNNEKSSKDVTYYVRTGGSNSYNGLSDTSAFKTIAYAISRLPKIINHNVTIDIGSGGFSEEVLVNGYTGSGKLFILGVTGATTVSNVIVSNCQVETWLFRLISNSTVKTAFALSKNMYLYGVSLYSTIGATTVAGLVCSTGVYSLSDCLIANRSIGLQAILATVNSQNWNAASTGNTYGIQAVAGATVSKSGPQPSGTTAAENVLTGGLIR